jgi:hypothetical protein
MAALKPATKRIKYLLTGGDYQASPTTITKGFAAIRSYEMNIILGENGLRYVTGEFGVSPTTDRHIRAAHQALQELGYEHTGQVPGISYRNPGHDGGLWDVYEMREV